MQRVIDIQSDLQANPRPPQAVQCRQQALQASPAALPRLLHPDVLAGRGADSGNPVLPAHSVNYPACPAARPTPPSSPTPTPVAGCSRNGDAGCRSAASRHAATIGSGPRRSSSSGRPAGGSGGGSSAAAAALSAGGSVHAACRGLDMCRTILRCISLHLPLHHLRACPPCLPCDPW